MKNNIFDNVATIYAKYRPSYPDKYINYLIDKCNLNQNTLIADIGAGTGILTKQFLDKNLKVIGVEPNCNMRKVLEKNLIKYKNFTSINGSDKNTNLNENSIDLITVAQAFHWFDIESFKKECKRILNANGKVCIIWNKLDTTDNIVKEEKNIDYSYTNQYKEINNVLEDGKREQLVKEFFGNNNYECKITENNQIYNKETFIGVNLSKSYSLRKDDKNYSNYIKAFENLFDKYNKDGTLVIKNNTYGYLGSLEK